MRYAVIGAGVLGLTVALRLGRAGPRGRVAGAGDRAGRARLELRGGCPGPGWSGSTITSSGPTERPIVADRGGRSRGPPALAPSGLDGHGWDERARASSIGGLRSCDSAGSPPSIVLRMAAAIATIKLMPNPRRLEGSHRRRVDAARRAAPGVMPRCWEPLLKAKFGASWDRVSMGWLWARDPRPNPGARLPGTAVSTSCTRRSAARVEESGGDDHVRRPVRRARTRRRRVSPSPGRARAVSTSSPWTGSCRRCLLP